jgi:hypothetical protein
MKMDGLAAPFLTVVLGSFVLAAALLMGLIFVDGMRRRRESQPAISPLMRRDRAASSPRQPPTSSRRGDLTLPPRRAKA